MQKRVFIIHGWSGNPKQGWFPWLKAELKKGGFEVHVPQLPKPETPLINNWIPKIAEVVAVANENTYFVGHSMGCQAIVRYLETLPKGAAKVGGVVFVAGFFKRLTGLEDHQDAEKMLKNWLIAPVNFAKIKSHISQSVAIFSDNDPYVPLDNQTDFKNKLGSKIIIQRKMGHFSGNSDGITELPVVLKALLKMAAIK